jgi:hypothetical protein
MSHVNAEKTVASSATAKMMDTAMGKMGLGSMMKEGMGPMMGGMSSMMNEGMGPMMKEGMGPMMGGMGSMMKTPGIATGVVVTTGSSAGKSVIKKVFTHPLVLFGLGVVAGCYLYKYRKSILSSSVEPEEE